MLSLDNSLCSTLLSVSIYTNVYNSPSCLIYQTGKSKFVECLSLKVVQWFYLKLRHYT